MARLQSGADAAALGVAQSCAASTCVPSVANGLADANSSTGYAKIDLVCGSGTLGPCPASLGTLTDCPAAPAAGTSYVDVHTSTLTADGSGLLPPVFARTLLGNGNYQGASAKACAQAEWGADGPGMFGWTADSTGNCQIAVTGSTYSDSTGTSASQACKAALATAAVEGSPPALIPVYSEVSGQGSSGAYTLLGFAAFVITGYPVPGSSSPDWLNHAHSCSGSQKCIFGYFTQELVPAAGSPGGTNLGAEVVELTG